LTHHRRPVSDEAPDVLGFLAAEHVAIATCHRHTKIGLSRRILAVLNGHDVQSVCREN
jgi:hypothetical protein